MRSPLPILFVFTLIQAIVGNCHVSGDPVEWSELPPLPDPVGYAGPFAGVVDGNLLVAGGANFPRGRPWEGAQKVWHDTAFLLDRPDGEWRAAGKLPGPLAYGISISTPDGLLCMGGSDAGQCHDDVFMLRLQDGVITTQTLPSLPEPIANACGVLIGDTVHILGGVTTPTGIPSDRLWLLDLSAKELGWEEGPSLPGAPRMLATAGTMDGNLYVFSGTGLVDDGNGGLVRQFLTDAWSYNKSSGWTRLSDLPEPRVAAPGPAIPMGMAHLMIMGGDTGEHFFQQAELKDNHPGFTGEILAYHTITDTWTTVGTWPVDHGPDPGKNPALGIWSTVTVPTVEWNGQWILPSGEIRPGVRTPRAMSIRQGDDKADVGTANIVTLVLYLGSMLGIGFYFSRREKSTDRFFRGGQTLPWWAVGLSIYATMLSSITFMAIPAKAYTSDWSYFFANVAIVAIAPIVISLYLPFYRRLDVTSAYEYLEKRFNLATRLFGSTCFILLQIGRMAIVLYLPAMALSSVSSLDVYTCILLMAVLCIVYTVIGGIEAVIWTDVVQTFVLLGGAILSFVLILFRTDNGIVGFFQSGSANHKFFEDTVWFSPDLAVASVVVIFVGSLFNNLISYTAGQDVVQRYMTTRSQEKAARSIWTNALLALPGTVLFLALGTAFFVFYQANPGKLSMTISNDQILPLFVVRELPLGIAGLVIAGIMAASQSTLSSSLNSVSAVWMTDFHKRLWPGSSDARTLRLAQICVLLTGVFSAGVACVMASLSIKSLFDAFIGVIGMTGGAMAGLFALGIFTRSANGKGALTGAVTSIVVLYLVKTYTDLNFFLYGMVGVCTCFIVGLLASLVLPADGKSLQGLTLKD